MPRPIRHVVMGRMIKVFGLDKNADAAEGNWGMGFKKERRGEKQWKNRHVSRKAGPTNARHWGPKLPLTQ